MMGDGVFTNDKGSLGRDQVYKSKCEPGRD